MSPEKIRERLEQSGVEPEEYVRALRAVRGERPRESEEPPY